MRKEYLPPKCGFAIQGDHIVTDGTVRGKVTGTMMAGILGCSPWSSPFSVACRLLGLAEEDIGDKPAVKAGRALERRVLESAQGLYGDLEGLMLVPAEEIYAKREGDHASWVSDFDDPIFAGHVDGVVFDENGTDYILEIKTSGNIDAWADGVPEYYWWQVALYNRFITKRDHAYVVRGMVTDEERRRPEKWEGSPENVRMYVVRMDDLKMDAGIEEICKWYEQYIEKGVTPAPDPTRPGDVELFEHLQNLADTEEAQAVMVARIAALDAEIKAREEGMKPLYDARDMLRGTVKDWMSAHDVEELRSADGGFKAVVRKQVRASVDQSLMMAAGIDPTPYMVEKVTNVFTVKQVTDKEQE